MAVAFTKADDMPNFQLASGIGFAGIKHDDLQQVLTQNMAREQL
jgi:hypothetical protein